MTSDVDALVRAGKYLEAAQAARETGDHARARDLFEKSWEFRAAAECARAAGDQPGALRNLLEVRALDEAAALAREIVTAGPEAARVAAETYAAKRFHGEAAAIFESLGELERA